MGKRKGNELIQFPVTDALTKPSKDILPFRFGDTVEYTGKKKLWRGQHIINECQMLDDEILEYSTDQGAWIPHYDFKLISDSNAESRRRLMQEINEEIDREEYDESL